LRKKFPARSFTGSPVLSNLGFDLLSKLLSYDPEKVKFIYKALNSSLVPPCRNLYVHEIYEDLFLSLQRITAETALNHDWFREVPLPRSDFKLNFPVWHDQER
jgi:cell division cycle 2-like protein